MVKITQITVLSDVQTENNFISVKGVYFSKFLRKISCLFSSCLHYWVSFYTYCLTKEKYPFSAKSPKGDFAV